MEQRQSAAGDHLAERPAIGQDGVGQELALATGRTAIVTDSTADLAPEAAAAVGVRVVPLFVRFGVEESRVGVDLSTEQFCTPMLRCLGGLRRRQEKSLAGAYDLDGFATIDLPAVPFTVPASPRLRDQYGISGAEYVCATLHPRARGA